MAATIFVTGASGFLGSHIVLQLLENGYRVRAAARGRKVAELIKNYARYGDKFDAVTIADVINDQFPDALRDIDAVIHCAAPLAGALPPEGMLKNAIEGTLNILHQIEQAGIKRIVVSSSLATVINSRSSFTDKDWNPATKENVLTGTPLASYRASKTLAERELWAFGDEHPDLDITTLNPPFLYGPFVEGFTIPEPNYDALSSNLLIYNFLSPSGTFPISPGQVDVRDVAKAFVLALKSPPTSLVGRKRIIFTSPHGFDFKATVDLIAEKRPELKERLIKTQPPALPYNRVPIDFDRVKEVLGMDKDDFKTLEETILDTVDSLLAIERQWISQGHEVYIPNGPT